MAEIAEKKRAVQAVDLLEQAYPEAICSLHSKDPLQLLVATRLAAQCTDARVNTVTPALFARYPDAQSFADADLAELEEIIRPLGFYHIKAKDLIGIGRTLVEKFGGEVPDSMEALTSLPGIGRKTANLVLGDIFGKPAVVTDTHFIRMMNRLGFVRTKDPYKVEAAMRALLPADKANDFCHRTVLHGRAVCTARKAYCERCVLAPLCPTAQQQHSV